MPSKGASNRIVVEDRRKRDTKQERKELASDLIRRTGRARLGRSASSHTCAHSMEATTHCLSAGKWRGKSEVE